jgi:hypothetical protein
VRNAVRGAPRVQSKATAPEPLPEVDETSTLRRTNAEVERMKRPGGIQIYQARDTANYMPPRELIRCSCGVRVMRTHDEMLGHVRRSHGAGAGIVAWFGPEALDG